MRKKTYPSPSHGITPYIITSHHIPSYPITSNNTVTNTSTDLFLSFPCPLKNTPYLYPEKTGGDYLLCRAVLYSLCCVPFLYFELSPASLAGRRTDPRPTDSQDQRTPRTTWTDKLPNTSSYRPIVATCKPSKKAQYRYNTLICAYDTPPSGPSEHGKTTSMPTQDKRGSSLLQHLPNAIHHLPERDRDTRSNESVETACNERTRTHQIAR